MKIKDKDFELFISEEEIQKRCDELGGELSGYYKDHAPLFIPLLNGAFLFAADLIKRVTIPCEVSFVKTRSYEGTQSTGAVKSLIGLDVDVKGRNVVLVDDIVDTGLTMFTIMEEIRKMEPASMEIVSLLLKPEALQKPLDIRFVGFTIPNAFVAGYGLDYDGYGRNLKDIYRIKS